MPDCAYRAGMGRAMPERRKNWRRDRLAARLRVQLSNRLGSMADSIAVSLAAKTSKWPGSHPPYHVERTTFFAERAASSKTGPVGGTRIMPGAMEIGDKPTILRIGMCVVAGSAAANDAETTESDFPRIGRSGKHVILAGLLSPGRGRLFVDPKPHARFRVTVQCRWSHGVLLTMDRCR